MKLAGLLLTLALPAAAAPDYAALHREVQACALHIYLLPASPPRSEPEDAKPRDLMRFEQFLQPRRRSPLELPRHPRGLGLLWHDTRHVLSTQAVLPAEEREGAIVVVEDAAGRRQRAEPLGEDPRSGAVLLRLAQAVPEGRPCRWGSAAGLQLGQELVGIGNLGELRLSLQRGQVSGLQRAMPRELTPLIESSVGSGQGMAGGPLLDAEGRVVGVHHAVYGHGASPQMAALALPAEALTAGAELLLAGRRPQISRIGVRMDEAEPADAQAFIERPPGVRISQVEEGGPAARAGLREGDRLLALDGRVLSGQAAWAQAIAWLPAAQAVRVQLQRGAERLELRLMPEALSSP